MKMGAPQIPITEEQFEALRALTDWSIDEVPSEKWGQIPGLQRRGQIVAIMASGDAYDSKTLNSINAIVGMDVLVSEDKRKHDEPEGNAYHYVFAKTDDSQHPYTMYGPYIKQTRVKHWFDAEDLDTYFRSSDEGPNGQEQ
jgi:hypothetical protein